MILKDFEQGGFPINRRCPVICISSGQPSVLVAYNNYDLKTLLNTKSIIHCIGVWPGKKNSDCFLLDINYYGKYAPPVEHKDIDSAQKIEVTLSKNEFIKLTYNTETETIVSEDKNLYDYLKNTGLKHLLRCCV